MQKFNYHSHTYRCGHADLDCTDEEYVLEYIKMKFEKIAFTDHCPEKKEIDIRPNIRMRYNQREEYLNSINELKKKYSDKIEIQSGYEIEYLPGEEENIFELKNETDKIILGQHFIYDDNMQLKYMNQNQIVTDDDLIKYASYIDKAMELGIPNIIAHPDLFMKCRDGFGKVEENVANLICKSAEYYKVPLEINLSNIFERVFYENKKINKLLSEEQMEKLINVKYPCKEFWSVVAKYNVKVLYGLDVHHKGQVLLYDELVQLANRIIGEENIRKLTFIK